MEGACICTILLKYSIPALITAIVIGLTYFLNRIGFFYVLTHKVDIKSPRHGGELVSEVLESHGIKFIFTLVGGHISPILVASEKKGIKIVDVRHEASAVFAADAVARLSGTVGVAAVTAGPGLTNTVTAIKNAQMAESPVLLLGGAAAGILKGRGALQDIDQMVLFKPLCKYTATIRSCREIIPTLRKALQEAQSGVPGPVFVEFPIDTLYPCELVKKEIGAKDGGSAKGLFQKIAAWYLDMYMRNIFSGAWEKRNVAPLPVHQPKADSQLLEKAADIVRNSKKPVILLGSQATLPPVPADDLRRSLEAMGIPCFLGGMTRGLLGRNSPIHIRQRRRDALAEADVVIMAGAVADFRLSYGRVLKKKSKIIAINRSKEQLWKNTDMFWKPTVAALSDVGTFMVGLQRQLSGYRADESWASMLKARDTEKETANEKKGMEETQKHLNPINVLHRIENLLPDNAILVADGGDFVGTAAYIVRPRGPLTWLDPGAFGTLGVGGGFALGAKLVRPDAEVWIVYGDGSLGYSVAEMDTYTRFKTPVICLVGNDACWSQIAREQVPMFKTSVACDLEYSAYERVADGYGGKGYKIDRSNVDQLEEIVKEVQENAKNGTSSLLNVLIGKTNFREGSISV